MKEERYIDMKSPLTGGRVKEVRDVEVHAFRGKEFSVGVHYYVCEDTGEQFTCDGQDDLVMNQVYNQYRRECGVPFPEEIAAIRSHYGLKQTQISKIVGFGINQWKSYEDGAMPSDSNAKMILTLRKKDSMLALLESSRNDFGEREYNKLVAQIKAAGDFSMDTELTELFYGHFTPMSIMNGFGAHSPERVMAMVRWLVKRQDGITPTKLNKLMFYSDFHHYRKTGRSISGLQYRAIQYGPVPEHYDTIYDNVMGLEKRIEIHHERECSELHVVQYENEDENEVENENCLSENEIKTLTEVMKRYSKLTTTEIIALSHEEEGWKKHQEDKSFIPYDEAFALRRF